MALALTAATWIAQVAAATKDRVKKNGKTIIRKPAIIFNFVHFAALAASYKTAPR